MNLLEKIDMFYKMAQKLEENPLSDDHIENIKETPKAASVQERMTKLAKLTKRQ